MADEPTLIAQTAAEVAKLLGVNRRTYFEWREEGCPGKGENGYDVEAIRQWRATFKDASPDDSEDTSEWQLRKLIAETKEREAKAVLRSFEAQEKTEDVAHLDDVEAFMSQFLTETRRLLERLPKEMSAGYAENIRGDMQIDLTERLDIVMRAMHGWLGNISELRS